MDNLLNKKVKIREGLIVDKFYGGLRFHNGMKQYEGKIATVICTPHYCDHAYNLKLEDGTCDGYDYTKEMLEEVNI